MSTWSTLHLAQPPRRRLSETVAQELLSTIRDENLPVGSRLPPEHELMRLLSVGRSTVREALNALAHAGVVDIRHGHGYFVASHTELGPQALHDALDKGLTADLIEARLLIEPEMAALASERATPEELAGMEQALVAYERAVQRRRPAATLGTNFHVSILDASHNGVLNGVVKTYTSKVIHHGHESEEVNRALSRAELEQHRALYQAVLDRDPNLARQLMNDHIEAMRSAYIPDVPGGTDTPATETGSDGR